MGFVFCSCGHMDILQAAPGAVTDGEVMEDTPTEDMEAMDGANRDVYIYLLQ